MLNYKVREIFGGDDGKTFFCICFDFDDGHEALSGFLVCDSQLIFGRDLERLDEAMKEDFYEAAGNAYTMEMTPENVTVTLQFDIDDEERSECISREDFIWVMNEWARECRRVKKEYGRNPCKKPKKFFARLLDRRFFVRKEEKRRQGKNEI